jgi:hypothetical protein
VLVESTPVQVDITREVVEYDLAVKLRTLIAEAGDAKDRIRQGRIALDGIRATAAAPNNTVGTIRALQDQVKQEALVLDGGLEILAGLIDRVVGLARISVDHFDDHDAAEAARKA